MATALKGYSWERFVSLHLLRCLGISVLHKCLESLALLKGGNLLDVTKRREHQVQRLQSHIHIRLQAQSGLSEHKSALDCGRAMKVPGLRKVVKLTS